MTTLRRLGGRLADSGRFLKLFIVTHVSRPSSQPVVSDISVESVIVDLQTMDSELVEDGDLDSGDDLACDHITETLSLLETLELPTIGSPLTVSEP